MGKVLRPRAVKEVVRDIAEALVAMANADSGTVMLGMEDDGTVSGLPERYDPEKVRAQIYDLIRPRLNFRLSKFLLEGKSL
ncbi:MAG: ATP-binding protein [Acidobacteria bacterium]|nr:MAG: ATP-binding protein [Acidobacteriota bacterium]